DMAAKVVESMSPSPAERLVIKLLLDNDVRHGEEQRTVRSRSDRDPLMRFLGRGGEGGIYHNELGALRQGCQQSAALVESLIAVMQIEPEQHDDYRPLVVVNRKHVPQDGQGC